MLFPGHEVQVSLFLSKGGGLSYCKLYNFVYTLKNKNRRRNRISIRYIPNDFFFCYYSIRSELIFSKYVVKINRHQEETPFLYVTYPVRRTWRPLCTYPCTVCVFHEFSQGYAGSERTSGEVWQGSDNTSLFTVAFRVVPDLFPTGTRFFSSRPIVGQPRYRLHYSYSKEATSLR